MVLLNLKFSLLLTLLLWKFRCMKTEFIETDINICENVADHIFIQDIKDCTKYFVCVNGRAKSQQCRAGLYFNANLQACISSSLGCLKCPDREMFNMPLVKTCDKYIICYYGDAWLRKCENNQQFNRITGKCDHAYNVDCVDDRCSIHPVGNELIYAASANSCENYYVCLEGKAKMMTCPHGLQFSTKCNCCDKREKVRCMIEVPEPTLEISIQKKRFHSISAKLLHTPILIGEAKSVKCPPKGSFILPYIGNPDKYITCLDGKASMYTCGSGYQFDDKLRRCVTREEDETDEDFPNNYIKVSRVSFTKQCPEFGASIMAHEENNKYIVCVNGKAEIYKCPKEQYFDASDNVCRNVTEMKRRRYGSVVEEFAGIICPKYATFTFPHKDRHKFYLCLDGTATVFTCADGQYFDVTAHGCREEEENENFNITITNEEFDYASAPFDAKCPPTGRTTLPHIQRNQYYLCVEGKSAVFNCAEGLVYDVKLKNCTENIEDHELHTPEIANIMCPKFGTFKFPHANKTKYYLCLDGKTYTLACDLNEYFDVEINLCKLNETLLLEKQNETLANVNLDNDTSGNTTTPNNTSRLALTSVASELVSNVICPKTGTYIYPHAQRNRYYVCIEGSAIVFICAEGHSFNIKTNTCERDTQASEENNELQTPMVLDEPVNILCPAVGALKFAHEDKNKFYLCVNGMGAVLACANGTFYDHKTSACRRPVIQLSPSNTTFETLENSTLSNETEIFVKCPIKGTFIYAHNDTQKYYVCMDGQAVTLSCPEGLQFNAKEKVCLKRQDIVKLTPKLLNETSNILCPLSGVYKYPHIKENQFYLCINGMGSVLACPEISKFDAESGNCLAVNGSENVTISNENSTNLTINTTTTATLNLTCPLQGTFVYPLGDPHKYAICLNGTGLELNCPQDYIFNNTLNKCLPTKSTELNNFKCPFNETAMFPHKDNNKFYLCINGVAIEQTCALDDVFDNETRTCREPSTIQKQFKIFSNIQCPMEGTFKLPHVEKTKFYLCVNGVPSIFSCAKGEYFDAETESCQESVNIEKLLKKNDLCPLKGTRKLAHPDRNKYYLCLDGLSTTYSCAEGDYFDAESETCQEAKINRKVKNAIKEYIECPPKGSSKIAHKDPNKFYLCLDGIASIQSCAKGDTFDVESETCQEAKDNGNKVNNLKDYRKNAVSLDDSNSFNCPEHGSAKFPHPDSNKFYLCLEGVPIVESCLEGDFYDIETESCRERHNKNKSIKSEETSNSLKKATSTDFQTINCPLQGSVKLAHNDPNKFYLCLDGIASIQSCAKGDVFDVETETCRETFGNNVTNENKETLNGLEKINSFNLQNISCPLEGTTKLAHEDPNKFYLCLNGFASLHNCSKGNFFNVETQTCSKSSPIPNKVEETSSKSLGNDVTNPIPEESNEHVFTSKILTQKVSCPPQGSVKLPHDNPNKFYLCLEGFPLIQSCLEGDVFDNETKTCRENTTLGSSIKEIENIKCPPKGSSKIAHKDSSKFYLCLEGIISIQSCAKGDFFDVKTETCRETTSIENEFDLSMVKCPTQGSVKLPHGNPNKFILCLEGFPIIQSCSEGDFFDDETKTCRENNSQIKPLKPSERIKCPSKGAEKLPHADPNKFYLCLDGKASILSCAKGDIFDKESKICREKTPVTTTPDDVSNIPNNKEEDINIKCPQQGSLKLPHANPNQFYLCLDGSAIVESCAEGDIFDFESLICKETSRVIDQHQIDINEAITPVIKEEINETTTPKLSDKEDSKQIENKDNNLMNNGQNQTATTSKISNENFDSALKEASAITKETSLNPNEFTEKFSSSKNINNEKEVAEAESNESTKMSKENFESSLNSYEKEISNYQDNKDNNELNPNEIIEKENAESLEIICPPRGFAKISHDDRKKFYLCENGIATVQTCAEGDFYDPENGICKEKSAIVDPNLVTKKNSLNIPKAIKETFADKKEEFKTIDVNSSDNEEISAMKLKN